MPLDFGVTEVIAAGAIVSAVASAGSGLLSAQQGQARAKFEAEQYRQAQEQERLAALEQEVERRRQLDQIQSVQKAVKGTNFYDSGSLAAIQREDERIAELDIGGIRLLSQRKIDRLDLAARQSDMAGRAALYGGIFTAGSGLVDAAYRGAKLWPTTPTKKAA